MIIKWHLDLMVCFGKSINEHQSVSHQVDATFGDELIFYYSDNIGTIIMQYCSVLKGLYVIIDVNSD